MTTLTATEAKSRFGELAEQVRSGPITVTRSGRAAMVILSAEEYHRLSEIEDRVWGEQALKVIRTETPLGTAATAQWIESLVSESG